MSMPTRPASGATALTLALVLTLLLTAAPAEARLARIQGQLDRGGYTVVALAPSGKASSARGGRFSIVPPAKVVTLQIRDRSGNYLGPLIPRGKGARVVVGVRAGAKLGKIRLFGSYARPVRQPRGKWLDPGKTAIARRGVPIGAGLRGFVRSRGHGGVGPGHDQDGDGIPGAFDVDDDGDLVLDVNEPRARTGKRRTRPGTTSISLASCPATLCGGNLDAGTSSFSKADSAFVIAIVAAALAAASVLLQLGSALRRRHRRVEVDLRLGLPIYQEGGGDWAVFVEVTNNTDQPMRWVSAELELSDGRRLYLMQYPPGGELPVVLQPHDSHQTWTRCRDLERSGLELTQPIVAAARLDSGEVLRSPRRRLLSRSLAERMRGPRR
jgi:hypothetical protein